MKRKGPLTIELVKSSYQPSKAELEEDVREDIPGDTAMHKLRNLTRAMVEPVKVRWIDKPRSRR